MKNLFINIGGDSIASSISLAMSLGLAGSLESKATQESTGSEMNADYFAPKEEASSADAESIIFLDAQEDKWMETDEKEFDKLLVKLALGKITTNEKSRLHQMEKRRNANLDDIDPLAVLARERLLYRLEHAVNELRNFCSKMGNAKRTSDS